MGYRIWSAIQTFLGFLLGWLLLDSAVNELWVYGFLEEQNKWMGSTAVMAYIVIAIVIIQLIKSMVIIVRKD